MPTDLENRLIIAISSRALFDLDESNRVYETEGVDAYSRYQIENEDNILAPGVAFPIAKKLLNLNKLGAHVEVILLSRNSGDTGLRVFNSIEHYGLDITRAAFCSGQAPYRYVKAFGTHLFLSANPEDTREALRANVAAATLINSTISNPDNEQIRIAFDGDAVLFTDESERIYQEQGLEAFAANEKQDAQKPLNPGPFKGFLTALHTLQSKLDPQNCFIRTALVTARSAPSHERVIRTLRTWGIRLDEALFLGGLDKGEFLRAFNADIFFDDQMGHCESSREHVPTGHVPSGVMNV